MSSSTLLKQQAARRALDFIQPDMRLGLGTGSTAAELVTLLGERVKQGLKIAAVPTSEATRIQAEALNIPLYTLDQMPQLDLTIDGADELDAHLHLIKGGGGALLREKIVAKASHTMLVIADAAKKVSTLGKFPLPVEVIPFGLAATQRHIIHALEKLGYTDAESAVHVRKTALGVPFITDNHNYILDLSLEKIGDVLLLDAALQSIVGVVETGLFLGIAQTAIIAFSPHEEPELIRV
jgi:ribose 5-phosphate isomerase A